MGSCNVRRRIILSCPRRDFVTAAYKLGVSPRKFHQNFFSMSSKRPNRLAVRDEFLNLDFPTSGLLQEFSGHPFMRKLVSEDLDPMLQYFLHIREDFSWSAEEKTPIERKAIRQHISSYLEHAVRPFLHPAPNLTDGSSFCHRNIWPISSFASRISPQRDGFRVLVSLGST